MNTSKTLRLLSVVLLLCTLIGLFAACQEEPPEQEIPNVDYVANLKLDMNSTTKKETVTVKTFIDGDTTHFNSSVNANGVLKARYLAVNTPESTGKIEEWGKAASNFTRSKLESAESIIIESDDNKWNVDSTGGRHLVWVWYRTDANSEYRNLNLELLQNGLAIASNSGGNRYGETCLSAIAQAKAQKIHVYSDEKDPDFFYGNAIPMTLKELRPNMADYNGQKVTFEGVVTREGEQSVYIEEYDAETGICYGMSVYYGFSASGDVLKALTVGNRVRVCGTVSYWEAGGTYQVSGLTYNFMDPNDPNNTVKISDGHSPMYLLTDPKTLTSGKISIEQADGTEKEYAYGELVMSTSISMENLKVVEIYTTDNGGDSDGAMSITCVGSDGTRIVLRTVVLYDEANKLVTSERYEGKTLNVKGLVDYYSGSYQIKVMSYKDIEILD